MVQESMTKGLPGTVSTTTSIMSDLQRDLYQHPWKTLTIVDAWGSALVWFDDTSDSVCQFRNAVVTIEVRLLDSQDMDSNLKLEKMSEIANPCNRHVSEDKDTYVSHLQHTKIESLMGKQRRRSWSSASSYSWTNQLVASCALTTSSRKWR